MKDLKKIIATTIKEYLNENIYNEIPQPFGGIKEFLNEQNTSQVENVKLSIKDIDDEYIVLAKINNVIVGKLMFIKSKWKSILIASSVVVDPNYRRMGIATKMYNFAENKMNMDFIFRFVFILPLKYDYERKR